MISFDNPVYLDFAASTPCDPRVFGSMTPYFSGRFANASSLQHHPGQMAAEAIETARDRAARLIGVLPQDIVWTSGATESNNMAIGGVIRSLLAKRGRAPHIVTSRREHKSVLNAILAFGSSIDISYVHTEPYRGVERDDVERCLRDETALVSIMCANNEIGTINAILEIGELCRSRGIPFHADGTQWVGKLPVRGISGYVDLLSWSGHKIYGPKGIGALFISPSLRGLPLKPILCGGGQEGGLRAGSYNVPGIVGFGTACHLAFEEGAEDATRIRGLRQRLETLISSNIIGAIVNHERVDRVPHISSITFPPLLAGQSPIDLLENLACSSGSACENATRSPSHVLLDLGLTPTQASSTIRFSLGKSTSEVEIDYVAEYIREMIGPRIAFS